MVSSAFYWHEIECEIMVRNLDWSFKGKLEDARDEFMKFIESKRRTENYAHPVKDCSQMCKERGSDPSDVNVKNAEKINDVVANLQTDSRHRGSSAAQSQGTEMFISKHH
ncbi:uncharacterized protein [Montipora foliosa]|uniref:uncharacterized protein n=1 Tax=Montipora foliosa TaxID=591990 RepID=UPI0035F1A33D